MKGLALEEEESVDLLLPLDLMISSSGDAEEIDPLAMLATLSADDV